MRLTGGRARKGRGVGHGAEPVGLRPGKVAHPQYSKSRATGGLAGHGAPLFPKAVGKSSQELLPKYMDQDAKQGHQASSQSGLGVGCKLAPAARSCVGCACTCAGARISIISRSLFRWFPFILALSTNARRGTLYSLPDQRAGVVHWPSHVRCAIGPF